jgi:hypothetical protein
MSWYHVTIGTDDWGKLRDLQRLYDYDVFGQTAQRSPDGSYHIQGLLSDAQITRLRADGYTIEILSPANREPTP